MQIRQETVSIGRGVWGERLYEYQELNHALASDRDACVGKWRLTYFLLFREPGTAVWNGRRFESVELRRTFVETWFQDIQPVGHIETPTAEEIYLPLRMMEAKITSVVFIHDYIQIVSSDFRLNVYASPQITREDEILSRGDPGYCDALVGLIDDIIGSLEEQIDEYVEIRFVSGALLTIPWDREFEELAVLYFECDFHVWSP